MPRLSVYFAMNGHSEEAINFYKSCFGGEIMSMQIGESPLKSHFPASIQSQILHAELNTENFRLMVSDMNGPDGYTTGTNMAASINFADAETATQTFQKLAENGTVLHDFKLEFWGGMMGTLRDQFGVKWMVSVAGN